MSGADIFGLGLNVALLLLSAGGVFVLRGKAPPKGDKLR